MAAWIAYNLLIETLPAAQGRSPTPAIALAIFLIYMGVKALLETGDIKTRESVAAPFNYQEERSERITLEGKELERHPASKEGLVCVACMEFTVPEKDTEAYKKIFIYSNAYCDEMVFWQNGQSAGMLEWSEGIDESDTMQTAHKMLIAAGNKLSLMQETENMPEVTPGHVRLFAITKQGKYTAEFTEQDIKNPDHDLHELYSAALNILALHGDWDSKTKATSV